MDIKRFDSIFYNKQLFKKVSIKAYSPVVEEMDYDRGYIVRYFCQNASDEESPIIEIDDASFMNLTGNVFYKLVSLDWKIKGTPDEIREANQKSILLAAKKISSISLYLPYLLQFSKPN